MLASLGKDLVPPCVVLVIQDSGGGGLSLAISSGGKGDVVNASMLLVGASVTRNSASTW